MIRSSVALFALVCAGWVSSASGQVFYEPVRYQYQYAGQTFYYGGHDPRMMDFAASEIRSTTYTSVARSEPVVKRAAVYSDGRGFANQADHSYTGYAGMTASDARNEAYHNVPRYFRKADLLRAAVVTEEGTLLIPAHTQPTMEIKVVRSFGVKAGEVTPKGTILVIPKKWLEKPVKKGEGTVAAAE